MFASHLMYNMATNSMLQSSREFDVYSTVNCFNCTKRASKRAIKCIFFKSNFGASLQALKLNTCLVFVAFWLVCHLEKGRILYGLAKKFNCMISSN